MAKAWYALRTKPHKEPVVWQQVQRMGEEVYYPRLRVAPVNPRASKVRPYFPGYLFVRVDLAITGLKRFETLPHAVGLVMFGGEPGVVSAAVMDRLIRHLELLDVKSRRAQTSKFAPGDRVFIQAGPFEGYEAIFDLGLSGEDRVRVLLELIGGRAVPVELSARLLRTAQRALPA